LTPHVRRISENEWAEWCDASTALPIACDRAFALTITRIPELGGSPIPFVVEEGPNRGLIVAYPLAGRLIQPLTLSPLGLGAAWDYRGEPGKSGRLLSAFINRSTIRWRSIGLVRPFYWDEPLSSLRAADVEFNGETHALDLSAGYESLFASSFKGATRTCIRRSEENGVVVQEATGRSEVQAYFRMHRRLAEAKGGYVALYPESVFVNLMKDCARARLLVAKKGNEVIGGAVFLEDEHTVFYWHAAADRDYARDQPAYALLSHAIRDAASRGRTWLNFGSSAGLDSIRKFKESWGARPLTQISLVYRNPILRMLRAVTPR
jgi:hypothetical protein